MESSSLFGSAHQRQRQQHDGDGDRERPPFAAPVAAAAAASYSVNNTTSSRTDDDDENDIQIDNEESARKAQEEEGAAATDGAGMTIILPPPLSWFALEAEAADGEHAAEEEEEKALVFASEEQHHQQHHPKEQEHDDILPLEAYPPSSSSSSDDENDNASAEEENSQCYQQLKPQTQPPPVLPVVLLSAASAGDGHHHSHSHHHHNDLNSAVGRPLPAPSWQEISMRLLPHAARELLSSSARRVWYTARWSYAASRWHQNYSDYGNRTAGYYRNTQQQQQQQPVDSTAAVAAADDLPPFSSLSWVERQMVQEWRTYLPDDDNDDNNNDQHENKPTIPAQTTLTATPPPIDDDDESEDDKDESDELGEFDRARTLVPNPVPRPTWSKAEACRECRRTFGPTCLRHHCRLCGGSFCHPHSSHTHRLPHLGYLVPERVCDGCKTALLEQNLAERVAWRLARCRDFAQGRLQPYFEVGLDSLEDAALRITHAALAMARSIPLGAQATVAVETVDVLRKYGLNGIYTIMLRQEFLAAADLLLKALGINRTVWPLSVHELSAAIFYALAQHRAVRGMNPDREHRMHAFRETTRKKTTATAVNHRALGALSPQQEERNNSRAEDTGGSATTDGAPPLVPVCDPVPDDELKWLIFFAPIALNFIYVEKEVDMQLLAAQQGWRLVYAYLDQENGIHNNRVHDRPASALFVHEEQKIACVAVRGTSTIHDVITDIRQVPVPFPDPENMPSKRTTASNGNASVDEEWTTVFRGQGVAVAGMAGAAVNLAREHADSLIMLAKQGYRIRLVGHSLGGAVATLLGVLIYKDLVEIVEGEKADCAAATSASTSAASSAAAVAESDMPLRVYSYGTPSCTDLALSEAVESFVTTVVLHDDVVPRLTPTSCRGLLKHLLHIRETWVKEHFADDIRAFTDRAKTAWAPRWRGGFTLSASSSIKLKRYCRKQLQYGKHQLLIVKDKLLVGDEPVAAVSSARVVTVVGQEDDWRPDTSEPLPSDAGASGNHEEGVEVVDDDNTEPKLVMDFMGGIDVRSEGIVIDGDEFFDPENHLIDSSDDEDSTTTKDLLDNSLAGSEVDVVGTNNDVLLDEVATSNMSFDVVEDHNSDAGSSREGMGAGEDDDDNDDSPLGAVVLEETPLPRMFIPGKIVHVYSHRGVYKAAYVPRSFRELRRISLAGNMLSDHKTKSYFDALLEVRSVRKAEESPPQWTAFDEDDTCSCCASRFTWASTSDNEAQEARDKHNCRSCGSLVCEPCSGNRIPIPSIGLITAARVCDRCYNDIDGLMTTAKAGGEYTPIRPSVDGEASSGKPTRLREKRSVVVDELAGRVQASALTCS